jgi:hypothetical protein
MKNKSHQSIIKTILFKSKFGMFCFFGNNFFNLWLIIIFFLVRLVIWIVSTWQISKAPQCILIFTTKFIQNIFYSWNNPLEKIWKIKIYSENKITKNKSLNLLKKKKIHFLTIKNKILNYNIKYKLYILVIFIIKRS